MNVLLKCKTFCKKMNKTFYISPMKRLILVIIIVFSSILVSFAQPKALGIRGGYDIQLSYQHNVGAKSDVIEGDAGMQLLGKGLNAAAAYNFMYAQPKWTEKGKWGFYAGPAVKLGYVWIGGYLAIGAQLGMEYTFDFPLQISLDIRPAVGAAMEGRSVFIYGGEALFGAIPCLSLRYSF